MNRKKDKILVTVVVILTFVLVIVALCAVIVLTEESDFPIGIASVVAPVGVICASILDLRKSRKKSSAPQKAQTEEEYEIRDKEKLDAILREIKERTKTEYYKIHLVKEPTDLYSSKLGGVPYWELSRPYPTDSKGNKLVLLAQINFEKENFEDERLPRTGLLQFFIADDDCFGCSFGCSGDNRQENWRAVYHETVVENVSEEDIRKLEIPTHKTAEDFPMEKDAEAMALKFEKRTGCISTADYRFDDLFVPLFKEKFDVEGTEAYWIGLLSSEEIEYVGHALDDWGHKLLGYPNFTQEDIRRDGSPYDTLLLEIDSDDTIMWGDSGIANFFIPSEALKNRDFSKVTYSWDCC